MTGCTEWIMITLDNDSGQGAHSRRLFLALWPGPAVTRALANRVRRAQALCGGRPMRPETLHLTLAFLGSVPAERIPTLCQMVEAWTPHGGELVLNHVGRFAGPRIVWIGPADPWPAWLGGLHTQLWEQLARLDFTAPDDRFRPHVSLLRKAGSADLTPLNSDRPSVWRPQRCVLVASSPSEKGSHYEALAECRVISGCNT